MTATGVTAESVVRAAIHQLLVDAPPDRTSAQAFAEARFERGLAWVWFPEGYGGLGVERDWQGLVDRELLESGAPQLPRNVLGTHMGAPTIMEHGNELQRRQWLRRIYTSGEIWCQLFSEPGAGSDLGGLATRASYNGVEWQVTGQKVWTTSAFGAKWGLLVARTDPDVVKHEGITFFIIDMHQRGVEVRPLRQMNGEAEFNEVFLTDARIPDDHRIGQVGAGWSVLLSTLMNERLVFVSNDGPSGGTRPAERVVQALRAAGSAGPVHHDRAVRLWVDVECNRLLNLRTSQLRAFHEPGPDGSLLKLAVTELNHGSPTSASTSWGRRPW